jgi:hypothetical protein
MNTASGSPGLFIKNTASGIVKIGPAHVGATAPNATPATSGSTGNSTGEAWLDNSTTIPGWKIWNGSAFINTTPSGTSTTAGLVELATDAEVQTGSATTLAVTPAGLQSKVSDSTSTTSSTTIASSTAVKAAYDLANAALPKSGGTITGILDIGTTGSLSFEGSVADAFETTLGVVNPTATRSILLPNISGTLITTGDTGSVTSTMILDGTILDGDINASAGIVDTKLATISTANKVNCTALSGTIPSAVLGNSTTYVGTTAIALNRSSASQALTGVLSVAMPGSTSGTLTLQPTAVAGTSTITFPAVNGTAITSADTGSVTSTMILDATIMNGDINASAAIAYSKLASLAPGNILLGSATSVPTSTAVTGDVTITSGGVTAIGSSKVTSAMIVDGTIVNGDIDAAAAIALSKLATGTLPSGITVVSANIVDNTIVDGDISTSAAIALSKLATGALPSGITISSSNITANTIVDGDISTTAAIAFSKLATLTAGNVILGNASGIPTSTTLSGDVTVSNAGVTAIGASKVTSSMIVDATIVDGDISGTAAIALSKLATGALPTGITVASGNIVDGTIANAEISASAAIDGTKISPNFGSQNTTTTGTSTAASFIPTSSSVPTNGLYLGAANQLNFATASTARLIIDATGEVGIGAVPGALFHISGTAPIFRLTDTDTSVDHRINGSSTTGSLSVETDYLSTGTAPVFLVSIQGTEKMRFGDTSGCLALGSATTSGGGSGTSIRFSNAITGATTSVSVLGTAAVQSDVTANARIYVSTPSTAAAAFTLTNLQHFYAAPAAFGAGSAVTNQYGFAVTTGLSEATNNYGFFCPALTGTTTAYGFYSNIASAAGRYNFYAAGTAANYFAGNVGIGVTAPLGFLHVETPATTAGWQLRLDSNGLANESGFYRSATDNYEMVLRNGLGGSSYLTNTGGASTSTLEFNVQGAERFRIDSSGRMIIGHTSAIDVGAATRLFQVYSTGTGAGLSAARFSADTNGATIALGKSRGATIGANTAVISGDTTAQYSGLGTDGVTGFVVAGQMLVEVDGPVASGVVPGRITFSTRSNGGSLAERMRVDNGGNVGINITAPTERLHISGNVLATGTVAGSNITTGGNVTGSSASCTGNASTATALSSSRTFALTGDVTGSTSSTLSAGVSIAATVVDDSHNHTISTITDITSGTYTPTLTNTTNLTSSSVGANDFFYSRVGNIVTVAGKVTITATTANSLFQLRITLPVARGTNFGSGSVAAGCGADDTAAATARVASVNATQLITIDGRSNATTAKILGLSFSYSL